jgi:fatty acid desaturase
MSFLFPDFVAVCICWLRYILAAHALAWHVGFTVLHESVHRLVHRNRFLNDLLGWPTALVFTMAQPTFRAVHLQHHARTNDPARDPDFAVGQGPWWQRPVRVLSPLWEYRAATTPTASGVSGGS